MNEKYTIEQVREWSGVGNDLGRVEVIQGDHETELYMVVTPEYLSNPGLRRGMTPYSFPVDRLNLVRMLQQILREIDPTPEDLILQKLEEIRTELEKKPR